MSDGEQVRVDLHVKVLNERVIENARRAGIDVVVYAPHFTRLPEIRERASTYSTDDVTVVPAREVFTGSWNDRKHVLAIGLEEPVPDFITLEGAMAEFERQGAAVLAPHPEYLTVSLTEGDIRRFQNGIDAVEIFNPKHLPAHNRRASDLADRLDLAPFTSSYAHLSSSVGVAHVAFERAIESEADLVSALKADAPRRVVYANGLRRWRTTAAELAHLAYENTWKKVDRLYLSGTEPTHANHVFYDGRFDDVSVY
ncbi:PHP-associated domain-containing protein [Natronosalvus caseinilyticus]|uniref:PHP-associated domain-containing protein n=1 Tax=Natronosalvus caseinilyticus TaxID=2953747 RepID=UPI0028ADAA27|nr:PHP-associated domain-containing protein [Natronosalvus caseinilyticus]